MTRCARRLTVRPPDRQAVLALRRLDLLAFIMSYAPAGESSQDLWLERSYFVGGFLAAVAYGMYNEFVSPYHPAEC